MLRNFLQGLMFLMLGAVSSRGLELCGNVRLDPRRARLSTEMLGWVELHIQCSIHPDNANKVDRKAAVQRKQEAMIIKLSHSVGRPAEEKGRKSWREISKWRNASIWAIIARSPRCVSFRRHSGRVRFLQAFNQKLAAVQDSDAAKSEAPFTFELRSHIIILQIQG